MTMTTGCAALHPRLPAFAPSEQSENAHRPASPRRFRVFPFSVFSNLPPSVMKDTNNAGRTAAANLAGQLERLPDDEARALFRTLTPTQSAEVIAELETADAARLL